MDGRNHTTATSGPQGPGAPGGTEAMRELLAELAGTGWPERETLERAHKVLTAERLRVEGPAAGERMVHQQRWFEACVRNRSYDEAFVAGLWGQMACAAAGAGSGGSANESVHLAVYLWDRCCILRAADEAGLA